jgi:hypothetical protein
MKYIVLARLSMIGLLTLSACVQPASRSATHPVSKTADPLLVTGDQAGSIGGCQTSDANELLAEIGDGADALFQILTTDPGDLNTVHERANHLSELEQNYVENFAGTCSGSALNPQNISDRIEKLNALGAETDSTVIHALAAQIWNLFNSNIDISSDDGSSSNPFSTRIL